MKFVDKIFCAIASVFLVVCLLCIAGCRQGDKIIIRYAHVGVKDEPQSRFADSLAKYVNHRIGERIEIRVYPNSQLGNISELVDGVKYGFIGMSHHDFSSLSKFNKDLSVFNVPYIYRDIEHALKATNPKFSPVLEAINKRLVNKSGIRILGSFYRGTRQLTTNFPVYSLSDLEGKKIRGVPFPVWMSMIKGMGAIPTPVEFSELTTALLTGLVVGQENPLSNIYASKVFEVQSHVAMTNHMHSCLCVFVNEELWQKISEEDRETIQEGITKVSFMATGWIKQADEEIKKELEQKGITFIDTTNGLQLDSIKSSVIEQVKIDFPQWEGYMKGIKKVGKE